MKAAPFTFIRAEHLQHALGLLAAHGGDCKPIAGGQSLVPMMAMRLARPSVLVDINRLPALKTWQIGCRGVRMGPTTRQRDVASDRQMHSALPLLVAALQWVGHVQTRNRGTVGGSLVHADPAAEQPLVACVLDATLVLESAAGGERRVAARDFFLGSMVTATTETECLTAIEWPAWDGPGVACAFEELSIRHGDFAMAAAACQIQLDEAGICRRAAIGLGGMSDRPLAFPDLAVSLLGRRIEPGLARDVAETAAERSEPGSDIHADTAYRRQLGAVLLRRALLRAVRLVPAMAG